MSNNKNAKAGYAVRGKIVLITGANRGIGEALVEAFVEHGAAKVYAAVRTLSTAQLLVDKYNHSNDHDNNNNNTATKTAPIVVPLYMDLNQPESIVEAATQTATDVEIVINNAGILSYTTPLDNDNAIPQLQQEMQVHVYGLLHIAQAFAPTLKANGGGVLCQINSVHSLRCPNPSVATYSASKAAVYSVTQALRTSLQDQNTFVMSIHPGPVDTDMIASRNDLTKASPEAVAKEVIASMEAGDFLCFPDPQSKSLSKSYQPFADYVFEQGNMY